MVWAPSLSDVYKRQGRLVRVGKRADHAVRPVEVLSRRHGARIRQIIRRGCHIRIERNRLVERVGTCLLYTSRCV